ncbi:MAG: FecR family protein [Halopseudomonas sp.]|uniref:FecR family protein n=1 Tax=Halopseudomonas sp. TaxID=2901191 RepID=UPI003002B86C
MNIPRSVALAAVDWHLAQLAGETDEAELQTWLAASELHRRAWAHIQTTNKQFGTALTPAARAALLSPAGEQRRRAVKTLSLLLFAGSFATLGYQLPWRETLADIRTATGEQLTVALPGGGQLHLNTASAANLEQSATGLQVELLQGELMLNTASRAPAPNLRVVTAQGMLRPLGTRFAVQQCEGVSRVDVLAGTVEVFPSHAPVAANVMHAGQSAHFDEYRLSAPQPTQEERFAWTQGMLVATSMPLASFVQTLTRYRPGYLGCDPAIAQLRISGSYPLADTDRILTSLTQSLPVRLHSLSRYWVRLVPASQV